MTRRRLLTLISSVTLALSVFAATGFSSANAAAQSWPMFHQSAQHTGQSAFLGPTSNAIKWSFESPDGTTYDTSPVVGPDGTVYLGGVLGAGGCFPGVGKIEALNPDGSSKWEFSTAPACDGVLRAAPAVAPDGTVYFVGDGGAGSLWALNSDGTLRWTTPALSLQSSPTIGPDGTIYASDGFQYVYAFNPNGSPKWRFTRTTGSSGTRTSPAIGTDGTVYVGGSEGSLFAINADGTLKWTFATDVAPSGSQDVPGSPAVGPDGTIYVGSCGDSVYAVHPDGTLRWRDQVSFCVESSPAVATDGSVYVGGDDHNVYGINADGTPKWTFPTGNFEFSSPALGADGLVYIAGGDGLFYAFNPDGTTKWTFQQPYSFYSSPAIGSDGTLYIAAKRSVYAFGAPAGRTVTLTVPPGGTVPSGSVTTPSLPVQAVVTTPTGGTVSITIPPAQDASPTGYTFVGQQVNITAPDATFDQPLILVFQLDASAVPAGSLLMFRNGVLILDCAGSPGIASPDPCVSQRLSLPGGGVQLTILTSRASHWDFGAAETPLALTGVPAPITVNATSRSGATVGYTAPTAVDEEPPPAVSCDHASGSTFPIGVTTVTCSATDTDDTPSTATASFTVTVKGALAQLQDLLMFVRSLPPGKSLPTMVQSAINYYRAGDIRKTCSTLASVISQARAQTGKHITAAQASAVITAAKRIESVIRC